MKLGGIEKLFITMMLFIVIPLIINQIVIHYERKAACGVLEYKVIAEVLYCKYHGAYHKPKRNNK